MANQRGLFLSDIPFFQDYFTYLKAKKASRLLGIKLRLYIVQSISEYIDSSDSIDSTLKGKAINTPERFWDMCNALATAEGMTIAAFIEKVIAIKVGEIYKPIVATPQVATLPKAKLKPWELPKG